MEFNVKSVSKKRIYLLFILCILFFVLVFTNTSLNNYLYYISKVFNIRPVLFIAIINLLLTIMLITQLKRFNSNFFIIIVRVMLIAFIFF